MAAHLKDAGVEIKGYEVMSGDVKSLAAAGTKLWLDPTKVTACSS